jgi:NAD(P)-dependent dehydrogenase (short-subunit alcohol dehydrogenase family)
VQRNGDMTEYPLPNVSLDLTGQVALVTGATSGLGWRFTEVLASAGAVVIPAGRRRERLDELALLVRSRGGTVHPVRIDMTDAESIFEGIAEAEEALGTITIALNNAGIPDAQYAQRMSVELIDNVIGTNLRGPYILACEIARRLIAAEKPGRIINISSMGAFHYVGGGAALYSITKSAVARMSEVLAVEWAKYSINVNCIAPGAFNSEMMDGMIARIGEFAQHHPRKRMGDPAQLDSTLLYLCSPASEFVTGATIFVDDGQGPR